MDRKLLKGFLVLLLALTMVLTAGGVTGYQKVEASSSGSLAEDKEGASADRSSAADENLITDLADQIKVTVDSQEAVDKNGYVDLTVSFAVPAGKQDVLSGNETWIYDLNGAADKNPVKSFKGQGYVLSEGKSIGTFQVEDQTVRMNLNRRYIPQKEFEMSVRIRVYLNEERIGDTDQIKISLPSASNTVKITLKKEGESDRTTTAGKSLTLPFLRTKAAGDQEASIEKYIEEDLHLPLLAFDISYSCQILAYITEDADSAKITDQLVDGMEFVSSAGQVTVSDVGTENDHAADGTVSGKGTAIGDAKAAISGKTLTVNIDDAESLRGHWVKVEFDAKLDNSVVKDLDTYKSAKKTVTDNGTVTSKDYPGSHEGVPNKASYSVTADGEEKYKAESNEVTVEPATTEICVEKVWKDSEDKDIDWPDDAEVTVALLENGQTSNRTLKLTADQPSGKFEDLPMYESIAFTVSEKSVSGVPGDYTTKIEDITEESGGVQSYRIVNTLNKETPATTEVAVEKVWKDKSGKTIAWPGGAKVIVALLKDGKKTGQTLTLTSSKTKGTFTGLPVEGVVKYSVDETCVSGVSGAYTTKVEDITKAGGGTRSYRITNTRKTVSVKLRKVISDTSKRLSGAKLQIKKGSTVVHEWKSDKSDHQVSGLEPGVVYTVHEVSAPKGYEVFEDLTFVLNDDGTVDEETEDTSVTVGDDGVIILEDDKDSGNSSEDDEKKSESGKGSATGDKTPVTGMVMLFLVSMIIMLEIWTVMRKKTR